MPSQFFIGIFIVIYFLYSFVAFRNRFEENWRSVQLGDLKASVVNTLGPDHNEQRYMEGDVLEIQSQPEIDDISMLYLVWTIGVNNYYVLGLDTENVVVLKARTEVSRVGAGGE